MKGKTLILFTVRAETWTQKDIHNFCGELENWERRMSVELSRVATVELIRELEKRIRCSERKSEK